MTTLEGQMNPEERNDNDSKYVENGQILKVDHERWLKAQEFEKKCWDEAWHLGNDWNDWWFEKFNKYEVLEENLPEDVRIIEVGCGPFSNIRLIESSLQYKEKLRIHLSDPLIESYLKLPKSWVKDNVSKEMTESRVVVLDNSQLENLKFENNFFDLLICINVLDHVQDVVKCFEEISRVIKGNGVLVFGQDLTDWVKRGDPSPKDDRDQGHPIRINQEYCETKLQMYEPLLNKIVTSRNTKAHYGCLCYIGRKK